ncbi:mutator type transposase [Tanacetum coccineum]
MFYHYKLPNKSLDYGLRPLSCDADVVSLINLVANCKVVEVFVEYWLTSIDHQYLSPFKSTVEIEELDDDVLLNAPVVGSSKSKSLALGWVNKADVDVDVHEEQTVNVNDYTIDDRFELDINENLNLDDYTVYVDGNMNENVNIDENVDENMNENVNSDDENVNTDDENVNADDEYEQDDVEDEEVIGNDREDFIVDRSIEDLRKIKEKRWSNHWLGITLFVGQEFANKELAKARIKAYAVETRRKIRIVKNDTERLQAKCKGTVVESGISVSQGNLSHACEAVDLLHTNPQIPIKAVQEHMQKQFQVGVSKTKAFRAKAKAEVHLRGDQEQQYAPLWDYYHALKKANPNTTVKIDVYRAHNPHENVRRFKRIYVCLGALKDGFRASGRQLLGLDGAFMKRNYLGQLLTVVSVDANNGIYPVAYDRQKGLLPALKDLFPAAEHRYCVRHIHDNMNLINKGGQYKELLWKCATATTEVHFERAMDEFKGYNRMVFNRQLLQARYPHNLALEYVREYLMKRIVIVQKVIEKSQGPLTATVNEGIQNQVVVNLANRSCTCRKWEVSGIPCKHAVSCIFNMNYNGMQVGLPEDWVHQSMRLIPPYIPPQFGRPGIKRKKSAGEVTEMVKDVKLIRKGGAVTCYKCGQKGHNKRSCKGTSVAGSSSASRAATQPAMASASQPARVKQPQRQPQELQVNLQVPLQVHLN